MGRKKGARGKGGEIQSKQVLKVREMVPEERKGARKDGRETERRRGI